MWFQDAGAAFLVEGLPQSGVTRVWMKNTGISEPMQSRIHRCCVENALRRLAADDPTLSALHWFGTPTHDTAAERRGMDCAAALVLVSILPFWAAAHVWACLGSCT